MAAPALDWGARNFAASALEARRVDGPDAALDVTHALVRGEVFEALDRLARGAQRFELVIVDPPTYSSARGSRFRSGTDLRRLLVAALAVTAPGGEVLVSSNDRRLSTERFRRYAYEAAREAGRAYERVRSLPVPHDFRPAAGARSHLESLLLTTSADPEARPAPPPRRTPR